MLIKNSLAVATAALGLAVLAPAHAATGEEVVRQLTDLYNNKALDCGSATRPAFLCSGLVISPTKPSTATAFYSVSPADQAKGGVAVTYLRRDTKFIALPNGATTAFVFNPAFSNPTDHQDYNVLCAFPVAGSSQSRGGNGCGDSSQTTAVEKSCAQLGVTTPAQWLSAYRASGSRPAAQCSFDMRVGAPATAQALTNSLKAMRDLGSAESMRTSSELIVSPWKIDPLRSPSVMALLSTNSSGLNGSRLSQVQWYRASGQLLPIVNMVLPQTVTQDASFSYDANQQAIYPEAESDSCPQYIQSGSWVTRYDPGFKRNIATLSVVPTNCGRAVLSNQTNNFFNEMVSKFYPDPDWINNPDSRSASIQSMRSQLICHFVIARGKASYNLEPSRPAIDQATTNARGCNNF